jgi:hypothetical protein
VRWRRKRRAECFHMSQPTACSLLDPLVDVVGSANCGRNLFHSAKPKENLNQCKRVTGDTHPAQIINNHVFKALVNVYMPSECVSGSSRCVREMTLCRFLEPGPRSQPQRRHPLIYSPEARASALEKLRRKECHTVVTTDFAATLPLALFITLTASLALASHGR